MTTGLIVVPGASPSAWRVREASRGRQRCRGLLGTPPLAPGECLLLTGGIGLCLGASVHTFAMSYPVDVLFCDSRWTVIHRITPMPPNRLSRWVLRARHVVELPGGTVGSRPSVGEGLRPQPCP